MTQREIGVDTESFAVGLRAALRQDPDVVMIGEMRDAETIATALQAAETGHLLISTLHPPDAQTTISRILASASRVAAMTPRSVMRPVTSRAGVTSKP